MYIYQAQYCLGQVLSIIFDKVYNELNSILIFDSTGSSAIL